MIEKLHKELDTPQKDSESQVEIEFKKRRLNKRYCSLVLPECAVQRQIFETAIGVAQNNEVKDEDDDAIFIDS
eukprot:CAMPEP_0205802852 /NCGR_PEP_ID=MMETSP0205-20121125/5321_1 /ASSEMBLY_ACC=CAM_ASM_000278 /TAXON_ID=36767 /ORGANISM="Euplotes focardii, Strain TN1" /LENGTH=72 /DNA_ID=CAMNT_0053069975 /DNA_START=380 /DNA_END=594 /DNA_ORIENTATION=-